MTGTNRGVELAQAARGLVGVPFRMHGRNPAIGLDCIGVLSAALHASGQVVLLPSDYAMRMSNVARFTRRASEFGFVTANGPVCMGDVVLFHVGPCQFHLAIADEGGAFVHAHAGLRRVVKSPPLTEWSIAGHWRLDANN